MADEPNVLALDPAMNNAMVPHVMCNVRIMPEFAAARGAPQLVTCMGNQEIARAFSVTANPADEPGTAAVPVAPPPAPAPAPAPAQPRVPR